MVLAGGFGTRSADPNLPKILQSIVPGYRILDQLMDFLAKLPGRPSVTWVLHHQRDQIIDELRVFRPDDQVVVDSGLGTAAAFASAKPSLTPGGCLVVLGDTLISMPGEAFLEPRFDAHALTFFGRQTTHASDSDTVEVNQDSEIIRFVKKGTRSEPATGIAFGLSGLTYCPAELINAVEPKGDLQLGMWEAARTLALPARLQVNSWYSRDVGTAERLEAARKQREAGAINRRGGSTRFAIFLDRDGTLIEDRGESRARVGRDEIPHPVARSISRANEAGVPVFLVTNQPGIAKGFISFEDVYATCNDIAEILADEQAFLDDYAFCPHHPDSGWQGEVPELKISCECRKPADGLLRRISERHLIQASGSYVIGDTARDEGAALSFGAKYLKVTWEPSGATVSRAIDIALANILVASK